MEIHTILKELLEKKKRRENICNENEDYGNTHDFEKLLHCLNN